MYSDACVAWIVKKLIADPGYLVRVKKFAVELNKNRKKELA